MSAFVGDALAVEWLAALRDMPVYASLHIETPSTDNPSGSEVGGATYGRVPVVWSSAGLRTIVNEDPLRWVNLEQTSIGAVGLFSGEFSGELLMAFTLSAPVAVGERGSYEIGAQELVVTV